MNGRSLIGMAVLAVVLAACAKQPPPGEPVASAADRAACRQRAEQIYRHQNADEIFQSDRYVTSGRDAAFSGTGVSNNPTMLSSRYAHSQMISDCISSRAGNIGSAGATPEDLFKDTPQ